MKSVTIYMWLKIMCEFKRSVIQLLFYLNELTWGNVQISWMYNDEQRGRQGRDCTVIHGDGEPWSSRLRGLKRLVTLCIQYHAPKTLHTWKVTASLDEILSGTACLLTLLREHLNSWSNNRTMNSREKEP